MINLKIVLKISGILLSIEALFLLGCSIFPFYYKENDLIPFVISAGITALTGLTLFIAGKNASNKISRKDGYIIVTLSWLSFTALGMLPYVIGDYTPNIAHAFFETMSGFTTTGATIFDNIESLPHGILFWRSLTQWLGGLGIVFFTIAVLPVFGSGGIKMFAAETTGPTRSKLHPRLDVTAKWIWTIYLTITILETLLLMAGDMPWFDSICTSLSTAATGGYSVRQNSIAAYSSPYIEYVIAIFMFLSGINFTLLYVAVLKKQPVKLLKDLEFRWYLGSAGSFIAFITIVLMLSTSMSFEQCFRTASFQVISIQTTTGFGTTDYMLWPSCTWLILCFAMIIGACAGSTTGAVKCIRIAMFFKIVKNQFKHMLHPNAVLPLRVNGIVIQTEVKNSLLAFFFVYIIIFLLGWLYIILTGVDFTEAFSISLSSLGNVGPGLGKYGPAYTWSTLPDAAKWGCTALMLIGRLEIFSVLLILSPGFWKKH